MRAAVSDWIATRQCANPTLIWPPPCSATPACPPSPSRPHTIPPPHPAPPIQQVELDSGVLLDSHTLCGDFVELGRSQGVHLRGQLLLVLGVRGAARWASPAVGWAAHEQEGRACITGMPISSCLLSTSTAHLQAPPPPQPPTPALRAAAGHPDAARAAGAARGAPPLPARHRPALQGKQWRQSCRPGCQRSARRSAPTLPLAQPVCCTQLRAPPTAVLHLNLWPLPQDDDALVIAQHEAAERRLRQQQDHPRSGAPPDLPLPTTWPSGQPWPAAAAAGTATQPSLADSRAGGAAAAATTHGRESPDTLSGGEGSSGRPGAVEGGEPSPLLGGLKQCLLAYLFREAQRQAQAGAAAAAAAPCSDAGAAACTSGGDGPAAAPGSLAGAGGSTTSLLSAAAVGQQRFGGLGGSSGGLAGLGNSSSSLASGGAGGGGPQQRQARAHWRRPLDRFCYYFQAYCELVMWKVRPPPPGLHGLPQAPPGRRFLWQTCRCPS